MATAVAAGAAGISAALAPLISSFANQNRSGGSAGSRRPVTESAIPVMAAADKKRLKQIRDEADKERLYNLLVQPEILGMVITLGGIFASNRLSFASNKERNAVLQSVATTASVLLGLGYAGVGDLTTLIIAAGAGGGSLLGSLVGDTSLIDLPDLPGLDGGGSIFGSRWLWESIAPGSGLLKQAFNILT